MWGKFRTGVRTLERPLNEAECHWLSQGIEQQRADIGALGRGVAIFGLFGFGVIAVLILWLARINWSVAVPFAAITSIGVSVWTYVDEFSKHKRLREFYDGALSYNTAHVTEIEATATIELEEVEDEGATFAFQVGATSVLFISGQDFYTSERFPNSHFSIVEILTGTGDVARLLVETKGRKLTPLRTIKKDPKKWADWPKHLQLVDGKLDDLERVLVQS